MAQTQVFGVRETLKEIQAIDKKLYFACVKQIKDAAKPLQGAILQEFSQGPPLSGMTHGGRTGWRTPKVITRLGGRKRKDADTWGLLKIVVLGTMPVIVDLAGEVGSGQTREYEWKGKKRTHKVNGQGKAMIQGLPGSPSRYIWPTTAAFMPMTNRAVLEAVADVSKIVNKNLVLRND